MVAPMAGAAENDILFFSKNDCVRKEYGYKLIGAVGNFGFDSEIMTGANCTYSKACHNDEIRSVWVGVDVKPGTVIKVWDSPDRSGKDDFANIIIRKVKYKPDDRLQGGRKGMCISTFEQSRSGNDYEIYYRRVNGLDGKISSVQIMPGR